MKRLATLLTMVLIALAMPALAWGPHAEITQAAMDVMAADDPIVKHLGPSFKELPAYSWMGDYDNSLRTDASGGLYYADDYLLFPGWQKYTSHVMPGVRASLEPYFRRSVQALRTETPVNAARWIGTLLHFTEDAGAPPHAYPDAGNVHLQLENWIDKTKLGIKGYEPQLLGETEDEALAAYMARMDMLVASSAARAQRMIPLAKADNRAAVEPIALEAANECSQMVADLLYTLGRIVPASMPDSAVLRAAVKIKPDAPADGRAAKVVIDESVGSTVAGPDGIFEFRNLPPGTYKGKIHYPGCRMDSFTVALRSGETRMLNILMVTLKPAGNLLRNPDLRVRWTTPDAPDCWLKTNAGWESDIVPVTAGAKYQLKLRWKPGATGSAVVRWYTNLSPGIAESKDELPVDQARNDVVFTAPEKIVAACVIVKTDQPITDVCDAVSFAPVK